MRRLLLVLALLLAAPRAQAAIAWVTAVRGSGGTGTSVSLPAFNAVSGNCIVAYISGDTPTSVTDTAGNSYTQAVAHQGAWIMSAWVAKSITANASNVVTFNFAVSSPGSSLAALQYSGVDTTAPVDVTAEGSASATTSITSGAFVPTAGGETVVAFASPASGPPTWTQGTNYTIRLGNSGQSWENWVAAEDYIGAGSGSQTAAFTYTPSASAGMVVLTLVPASAGGGGGGTSGMSGFFGVLDHRFGASPWRS